MLESLFNSEANVLLDVDFFSSFLHTLYSGLRYSVTVRAGDVCIEEYQGKPELQSLRSSLEYHYPSPLSNGMTLYVIATACSNFAVHRE